MRMEGWVGVSATDDADDDADGDEKSRPDLAVSITGASAEPALAKLLAQFFQGTPQVRVPRPIDPDYKPFWTPWVRCPELD